MPALHSEISHNLATPSVRKHLEQLLRATATDYADVIEDLQWKWQSDSLQFSFFAYGFAIAAEVHLVPGKLTWDGYVPNRATFVCGKIQRTIQSKLAGMLKVCARDAA
jgi:hypothetical protein